MIRLRRTGLIPFVCVIVMIAHLVVSAQDVTDSPPIDVITAPVTDVELLPGVGLAEGVTQLTGVAISPLLGVCAVGTWKYWRTDAANRDSLPWFCHPAFWGIGLGLVGLCFFKDSLGTGAPAIIKKPLDFLELFEDKFSAVIASAAFVPFVAKQMAANFSEPEIAGGLAENGQVLAMAPIPLLWIMIPLCIVGFLTVWVVSHAVNVLILLSPFRVLDTLLKLSRTALLSLLVLFYAISPVVAAVLAVIIIVIAAFLAPAAFRLGVFGTLMAGDYLVSIFKERTDEEDKPIRGFLARQTSSNFKAMSFGHLITDGDGAVHFESRRAFFGPKRTLTLTEADQIALANGMIFPSVTVCDAESGKNRQMIHLLPRHRLEVERVAETLEIASVHDAPLTRSMKAMWRWLKETIRAGRNRVIEMKPRRPAELT